MNGTDEAGPSGTTSVRAVVLDVVIVVVLGWVLWVTSMQRPRR
jgi:hypothetical protein